jgi:hypothetical protein
MSAIMDWTVLERLLLAQAVHKYGEDDWTQVARTLKQHPLLQGQARLEPFNQKVKTQYVSPLYLNDPIPP